MNIVVALWERCESKIDLHGFHSASTINQLFEPLGSLPNEVQQPPSSPTQRRTFLCWSLRSGGSRRS